jgi:hypothetical protein
LPFNIFGHFRTTLELLILCWNDPSSVIFEPLAPYDHPGKKKKNNKHIRDLSSGKNKNSKFCQMEA